MIENLLENIYQGYDGLIRKIEFNNFKSVNITISVIKKTNNEWVNIKFQLYNLTEFSVKQKLNYSNEVLSQGIGFKMIENIYYIDFSPYSSILETKEDFRRSDCYFAAHSIRYEEVPYTE